MACLYFMAILSLLLPSVLTQCSVEKAEPFFRRSVYEFSINLVQRIAQETENHFVTSALSSWTLLSTISLGATEETLEEIEKVLRLHPHKCFNNKFFEIVKKITSTNEGIVLERSSALIIDDKLPLNEIFANRVEKITVCELEPISFDPSYEPATSINDYVNRETHGTIDEMVSPQDLEGAILVLIDALYFKGKWKNQFPSADTETSAFYDEIGNQIGDVSLMFSEQLVNITNITQIDSTVLEIPYGSNDRFSMIFILPDTGKTISSVIEKLKTITISSILLQFKRSGPKDVLIQIPRFKISSDLDNLKELLSDMGLRLLFDSSRAQLGDISDYIGYSLYVSNIIQKANIEVTEEGTEASADTAAFFQSRSAGPAFVEQFVANKPFLYMIVDKETQVALFTGAYSKPSVY